MFLSAIHHFLDSFCVGELFTLTFVAVSQSFIISRAQIIHTSLNTLAAIDDAL